ncbi:MAG: PAS domain S-box protein [Methanobacterium sp.]
MGGISTNNYSIFDNLIEGIQIISSDWVYIYVNDAAAKQNNLKREDLLDKKVMEVYPGIEETELFSKFKKCMIDRVHVSFENEFTFPDGSTAWFESKLEPISEGMIILSADITEQKKTQDALKSEGELLKAIIDNIPVMISIYDPKIEVLQINNETQRITGWSQEDMEQINLMEELYPDPDYRREVEEYMQSLTPGWKELTMIARDGSKIDSIWANVNISGGRNIGIGLDIRKRKKAENELREALEREKETAKELYESREEYRIMGETLPYGVWKTDAEGKAIYTSQSFLDLLEMTMGEMQGFGWTHRLLTDEVEPMMEKWMHSVKTGAPWDSIHHILGPDGKYHNVLTRGLPVRDDEGNITSWVGINLDIDDRVQMEEELRQARDYLEEQVEERTVEVEEAYQSLKESEFKAKQHADLLEITHEAIYVRDMNGKITFWNRGAEELYGWTKKEAIGKISNELTKTEFPIPLEQIKIDILSKGRWDGELIHTKRDGTKINVLSRWSLQRDDKFNPVGFLEVNVDITDRKRAEEELKLYSEKLLMERKRFYDMLEELPVTISLLTPDYHVKFGNRAYREKFGEHQGRHCYDFIFGFDEPCHWCEAFKPLETGQPHCWDLKTPDGLEIENYNIPFTDSDGSPLILEMNIDVTDKKQTERQLKKTITELERSNEELQSFAYITSHDLQEPLRTIASYAQLIEKRYKGQLDSDADEFIDYLVSGSKRMKHQIQGLLEYSRVGTRDSDFWKFNAENALNHALSNLQSLIEENHAKITYEPLPEIYGDESQITQVFQNLIGNAIKFHKEGIIPKIQIKAKKQENEYIFSVEDNGIGLEEQYSDRIFEVFKRLHAIGEYDGAGIGLAIVKRIINRHQGRVLVESSLGKGSTFYFTIPIKPKTKKSL